MSEAVHPRGKSRDALRRTCAKISGAASGGTGGAPVGRDFAGDCVGRPDIGSRGGLAMLVDGHRPATEPSPLAAGPTFAGIGMGAKIGLLFVLLIML